MDTWNQSLVGMVDMNAARPQEEAAMWAWIIIGIGTYLALLLTVMSLAAAAKKADLLEREVFAAWAAERRKRGSRTPARWQGDHRQAA
jgi:hypothetical protein